MEKARAPGDLAGQGRGGLSRGRGANDPGHLCCGHGRLGCRSVSENERIVFGTKAIVTPCEGEEDGEARLWIATAGARLQQPLSSSLPGEIRRPSVLIG